MPSFRSAGVSESTWILPSLSALLASPEADGWRLWLGRAERLPQSEFGARQAFADALGNEIATLPWARASASVDLQPEQAERVVAIADPLQTRVEVFDLRLIGVGLGALASTAVAELIAGINQWIADDGLELVVGRQHWYLCGDAGTWSDPGCAPPDSLLGASLADALPKAPRWQRLLNETQMFLNQNPGMQQLRADGATAIDSLWFWGGASVWPSQSRVASIEASEPGFMAIASALKLDGGNNPNAPGLVEGPSTRADAVPSALAQGRLRLYCASGERFALRPRDRYRFWSAPYTEDTHER